MKRISTLLKIVWMISAIPLGFIGLLYDPAIPKYIPIIILVFDVIFMGASLYAFLELDSIIEQIESIMEGSDND